MIKLSYDATTGIFKGFYHDDATYSSIPEPYIEITNTIYQECMDYPQKRKVDVSSKSIVECDVSAYQTSTTTSS